LRDSGGTAGHLFVNFEKRHGKPFTDSAAETTPVSDHLTASRKSSLQYTAMLCACSYAHCLPGEILYRIASKLDLASQVSLACTNKHNLGDDLGHEPVNYLH